MSVDSVAAADDVTFFCVTDDMDSRVWGMGDAMRRRALVKV